MSRNLRAARYAVAAALVVLAAVTVPGTASARVTAPAAVTPPRAGTIPAAVIYRHTCAAPSPRRMACLAIVDSTTAGRPLTRAAATAAGLHPYLPADLQSAYDLPSALGQSQTVAIVDAYDDPNAESDLAGYRAASNLPQCTTANGCFEKVNQQGQQGGYPAPNAGWAVEESLDIDMVSAACPNCHILLVEASDNSFANLAAAEDEAATFHPAAISNSYGGPEFSGEASLIAPHYDHPGTVITASSGDSGFGARMLGVLPTVIAVGGTALYPSATPRGWSETAWSGAGSGCSAYIPKPAWQRDRLCGMRTVADVAAVADPATPVAVYDTYREPGWIAVGGTSVSSPLVASVYALAGNTASISPGPYLYSHHKDVYDVTSGSNGTCGGSYLCTAVKGYDGPTGWGTPNGTGAF